MAENTQQYTDPDRRRAVYWKSWQLLAWHGKTMRREETELLNAIQRAYFNDNPIDSQQVEAIDKMFQQRFRDPATLLATYWTRH